MLYLFFYFFHTLLWIQYLKIVFRYEVIDMLEKLNAELNEVQVWGIHFELDLETRNFRLWLPLSLYNDLVSHWCTEPQESTVYQKFCLCVLCPAEKLYHLKKTKVSFWVLVKGTFGESKKIIIFFLLHHVSLLIEFNFLKNSLLMSTCFKWLIPYYV